MISIKCGAVVCGLLSLICHAFGADLIPQKIQQLGIGTASTEIYRVFPDANVMFEGGKEQSALLLVNLPPTEIWDSGVFEVAKGKIVAVSLLRGVAKRPGEEHSRELIITEAIKTYGPRFLKRVALTAEKRPQPIFVWKLKGINAYLAIDEPLHPGTGGKERIQLTMAPTERDLKELFQLPSFEELENATFDWVMEDVMRSVNAQQGSGSAAPF